MKFFAKIWGWLLSVAALLILFGGVGVEFGTSEDVMIFSAYLFWSGVVGFVTFLVLGIVDSVKSKS